MVNASNPPTTRKMAPQTANTNSERWYTDSAGVAWGLKIFPTGWTVCPSATAAITLPRPATLVKEFISKCSIDTHFVRSLGRHVLLDISVWLTPNTAELRWRSSVAHSISARELCDSR